MIYLKLEDIIIDQPIRNKDFVSLFALSIYMSGLLTVHIKDGEYHLLDGYIRLLAFKHIKENCCNTSHITDSIPCIVVTP